MDSHLVVLHLTMTLTIHSKGAVSAAASSFSSEYKPPQAVHLSACEASSNEISFSSLSMNSVPQK